MRHTAQDEMGELRWGSGFLASVGSTSPFIGLFGTVWGIMATFQALGDAKSRQPRGRGPRHRLGPDRHRRRTGGRDPRGHGVQLDSGAIDVLQEEADTFIERMDFLTRTEHPRRSAAPSTRQRVRRARRRCGKRVTEGSPMAMGCAAAAGGGGGREPEAADGRDQRHAHGGRDARAAGDLHDHRAGHQADRRRLQVDLPQVPAAAGADDPDRGRPHASSSRRTATVAARPGSAEATSTGTRPSRIDGPEVRYREDCEKGKRTPVVVIAGDRAAKWERVMQVWNCGEDRRASTG